MKRIEYITYYDVKGYIITQFDSIEECSKYFNTSKGTIRSYISRKRLHYPHRKKRDKETKKWGFLIPTYNDEEEIDY